MANVDTGLGWFAKNDWLASAPGEIGSIESGPSIDYAFLYTDTVYIGNYEGTDIYFTVIQSSAPVYFGVQLYNGQNEFRVAAISTASFTADLTTWGRVGASYPFYSYNYYGTSQRMGPAISLTIAEPFSSHILPGSTPEEAAQYLSLVYTGISTTSFSKSTNGYSITCMCKWKTSIGGDLYCSPVLISSNPNYTLYTRNSATPSVNTTEHSFQGKTFYMRKAPLDVLNGGETIESSFPMVDATGIPQNDATIFAHIATQSGLTVGQTDPYSGAGESEPGAEEATFDFDSTAIDFGTPPTVTAAGMVELYIPSTSDLASLAQYLWAGSFDPDNFKKLFADPMDAIIGLQIVPVTATQIGTAPDTLYVGNISTGLSMPKASRQYVPVDCGSLSIPRRLGSYLDYSPHTEMQLYLPYIGFVDISPDDCMGGTVSVKYMVDIIGGTCVAQVKCNNHVLYEYAAACSCQVPVSAGQYQNIVLGAVRGGVGIVSGILGAAGGGLLGGLSEAADAAMSMTKPKIQRSGGFGGSSGLMGHQTPYIIYTVPRLIVPGRQNNFIGYPSYITRTLGDLTGFTQIDSIHLSGIPASQSEQAEIEQLLQEGVYL